MRNGVFITAPVIPKNQHLSGQCLAERLCRNTFDGTGLDGEWKRVLTFTGSICIRFALNIIQSLNGNGKRIRGGRNFTPILFFHILDGFVAFLQLAQVKNMILSPMTGNCGSGYFPDVQ
ncbi:MAG: hypothetical protein ACLRPT_07925 [Akkermansia muciniphila]